MSSEVRVLSTGQVNYLVFFLSFVIGVYALLLFTSDPEEAQAAAADVVAAVSAIEFTEAILKNPFVLPGTLPSEEIEELFSTAAAQILNLQVSSFEIQSKVGESTFKLRVDKTTCSIGFWFLDPMGDHMFRNLSLISDSMGNSSKCNPFDLIKWFVKAINELIKVGEAGGSKTLLSTIKQHVVAIMDDLINAFASGDLVTAEKIGFFVREAFARLWAMHP